MQPEEVVDYRWVGPGQFRRMEREGLLHPALKNFFTTYREKLLQSGIVPQRTPRQKSLKENN